MVLATYREKESRMIPSQTADEKQLTTAISVVIHTYYQDVILGPLDLGWVIFLCTVLGSDL